MSTQRGGKVGPGSPVACHGISAEPGLPQGMAASGQLKFCHGTQAPSVGVPAAQGGATFLR
jgi:hypothetical protein